MKKILDSMLIKKENIDLMMWKDLVLYQFLSVCSLAKRLKSNKSYGKNEFFISCFNKPFDMI